MRDFKEVLDKYFETRFQGKSFARIHYGELISVNPVSFLLEDDKEIIAKEEFLVIPKYRPFLAEEIGKKFVLMSNDDGQTYFYMYEASKPQGTNGVQYHWEGKSKGYIDSCNLIGHCSNGGTVITTHGDVFEETIERCTHIQNDNCQGGGCSANDTCTGGNSCSGTCSGASKLKEKCPALDKCTGGSLCPGDCEGAEELRRLGVIE